MRSRLPQLCVLLALCAAILSSLLLTGSPRVQHAAAPTRPSSTSLGTEAAAQVDAFETWRTSIAGGKPVSDQELERGLDLAIARKVVMLALIQEDPRQALEKAVTFSEYAELPQEVREHVERPFSARAELLALPVCSGAAGRLAPEDAVDHELIIDGRTYAASVYGRRRSVDSKESTPLQGITLEGHAAVREEVFQVVGAEDADLFPLALEHDGCFATGRQLGGGAVTALAGGKLFHFANAGVLEQFEHRIAQFDLRPGPHTGAQVIFLMADGGEGEGDGGFDWPAAEAGVGEQASTWTETPKDVYFIRIDFSDEPGASISQVDLDNLLNVLSPTPSRTSPTRRRRSSAP